jgi:hypothetical protein
MVYRRGRFVIHYKDGSTYIEDRKDPHAWDNRPKKPIAALGIQPDPNILVTLIDKEGNKKTEVPMKLESADPNIKVVLGEMTLKGSWKYDYGFFMDKQAERLTGDGAYGIRLGMVVDKLGHCVCLEYVGTGSPRMYYTTCKSLDMDDNSLKVNYDINLEELPDPADNIMRYPEINPAKLKEREDRTELLKSRT